MWMSQWDGTTWSVGHTQSDDGVTWTAVSDVTGLSRPAAAPAVVAGNGRYELWFASPTSDHWEYGYAWSWDGLHWQDDTIVSTANTSFDITTPPRLGVQSLQSSGFRLEGNDSGLISGLVVPGGTFSDAEHGFSIEVSAGYHVDGQGLGEHFANSIAPSSRATVNGQDILYIYGTGTDGQSHMGAISPDDYTLLAETLISDEALGNLSNPSHPVVFEHAGQWVMIFSAANTDNVVQLYLATSDDGLQWSPRSTPPT